MLDYLTLSKKPTININNEEGIDLLYKTINLDISVKGSFLKVNEYYIARPDLISLAVYGDDKYGDIICKINGISNPFELNENDILFIPDFDDIMHIITKDNLEKTTTINKSDTISTNNKIGNQKNKNEKRSPSQQIVGDNNFIIDKSLGVVFY